MKKITYTREDISRKLSYKLDMSKHDSRIIFDCVLDVLQDLLLDKTNNVRIELRNFGVFDVKYTKERSNARNPKTKEIVTIPKRKKIVFKASKLIRGKLYKELKTS